jgi:hypothetical protein
LGADIRAARGWLAAIGWFPERGSMRQRIAEQQNVERR